MKRVLLVGVILTGLTGCGGSPAAVGQNSADSITTTAVGNVVATVPTATPTPVENAAAAAPTPDNEATPDNSAVSNDASSVEATATDTAH